MVCKKHEIYPDHADLAVRYNELLYVLSSSICKCRSLLNRAYRTLDKGKDMADDREVLREIWDGRIPVRFVMSTEEVMTVEQPDPCYILVPRLSYFPLVLDKVTRHFQRASEQFETDEVWLEYEGYPLKWHYPIGVLFDLHGSQELLPWNLVVHFKKFPEKEILRCKGREEVEAMFMASIKEADCLKHKSQVMNAMQKKDHKQLWMGLNNDKFEQFWTVNKRLMERINGAAFRYIPFRIYMHDRPYLQLLFRPVTEKGELQTLLDLLQASVPHILAGDRVSTSWQVVVQGIQPPLETPVQWLSEHMSHPDNFLHICVTSVS